MSGVPFSAAEFFAVFSAYNQAVWPAQVFLVAIAGLAVAFLFVSRPWAARLVTLALAVLWVWTGVAYHFLHFSRVTPAAWLFGSLFVVEGLLLAWAGSRGALKYEPRADAASAVAGLLITYALVIYPVLGTLTGHEYPATPTFGAPCPMVIFTFGALLTTRSRVPVRLLIVPFAWGMIGVSAAVRFGVVQDVGLVLAAVIATPWLILRGRRVGVASRAGAPA